MVFRILILFIALLGNLYLSPFVGAELYPKTECPFSYKLPSEIKSFLDIQSVKKQRAQLVRWKVECRTPQPKGFNFLYSLCQIEPTKPHRRICQKTSRWNNTDAISIDKSLIGTGTDVRYLAIAPNDSHLIIWAKVNSDKNGPLVEKTLQTMIEFALTVRIDIGESTSTTADTVAASRKKSSVPSAGVVYKDTNCPFEFSLPKILVPKIKRLPNFVYYSGRTPLAKWSLGCGSTPQSHYSYLLKGIRCNVEPTPPHRRICMRSKRWDGVERLQTVTPREKSIKETTIRRTPLIQYLVYTTQDHWLFMEISFDKSANKADVENFLAVVQTIVQKMRYTPAPTSK